MTLTATRTVRTVKPPIIYMGSKAAHADWIIEYLPRHTCYVEVFGGSGALLLAKNPTAVEVYNDLDGGLVNLFSVLRDRKKSAELAELLNLTLYSREEHRWARQNWRSISENASDVERARLYYLLVMSSYNGKFGNTFSASALSGKNRATQFRRYKEKFGPVTERLQKVVIECRSFEELFPLYDSPKTLWYLDPPYVASTRGRTDYYANDNMPDEQHLLMLDLASSAQGAVVISGYRSRLYDQYLEGCGWQVVEKPVKVSRRQGARDRTEVLWIKT